MVSVLPAVYRTNSTTTRKSSAAKCFAWERVRRKRLGKGQFVVPPLSRESSLGPAPGFAVRPNYIVQPGPATAGVASPVRACRNMVADRACNTCLRGPG
jgi:hypothetical protein